MTDGSEFNALLDLLAELPETAEDVSRRGETGTDLPADRRHAVLRRLRTDPEARLTLFTLALEVKRGATGSERELRSELREFAAAVEDRFGVDLLDTAAANRDRVGDVPVGLFESAGRDHPSAGSD